MSQWKVCYVEPAFSPLATAGLQPLLPHRHDWLITAHSSLSSEQLSFRFPGFLPAQPIHSQRALGEKLLRLSISAV